MPVAWAAALMALVGCESLPPANVYLPTYPPANAAPGESARPISLPTALLEGTLVDDDGCLWIEDDVFRWLVLWPSGSSAVEDNGQVVVRSDGNRAAVGTQVSAGGGEYRQDNYNFVVELIGEQIPNRCRASGLYWLGYDVQTVGD